MSSESDNKNSTDDVEQKWKAALKTFDGKNKEFQQSAAFLKD